MTAADETRFLAAVRRALGIGAPRQAPGLFRRSPDARSRRLLTQVRQRGHADIEPLLARLKGAAAPLNLAVHTAADPPAAAAVIAGLAAAASPEWGGTRTVAAWRHPLVEALNLVSVVDAPVFFAEPDPALSSEAGRRRLKDRVAESLIGVTAADFCLADTATCVLRTRPGQARSVSLLPSIHVAVVERHQILADLSELYAVLRWRPEQWREGLTTCLTFISGPSKTADIEATLVHGAHGPRQMHLIVLR